ncbi:hypothetical protein DFH07DRAFT_782993 [Mycena maculata]|uniref:Uncharacterized protein n=1 Tax=Mycena maculata TaxID=230809 RepID=A0AAD7HPV9_9AGAR|nr:hypothetical protein DFH07DRAFT_782993 [Mycena maculata]
MSTVARLSLMSRALGPSRPAAVQDACCKRLAVHVVAPENWAALVPPVAASNRVGGTAKERETLACKICSVRLVCTADRSSQQKEREKKRKKKRTNTTLSSQRDDVVHTHRWRRAVAGLVPGASALLSLHEASGRSAHANEVRGWHDGPLSRPPGVGVYGEIPRSSAKSAVRTLSRALGIECVLVLDILRVVCPVYLLGLSGWQGAAAVCAGEFAGDGGRLRVSLSEKEVESLHVQGLRLCPSRLVHTAKGCSADEAGQARLRTAVLLCWSPQRGRVSGGFAYEEGQTPILFMSVVAHVANDIVEMSTWVGRALVGVVQREIDALMAMSLMGSR